MTGNKQNQTEDNEVEEVLVENSNTVPDVTGAGDEGHDSAGNEAHEEYSEEDLLRQELDSARQKAGENLELAQRTQAEMDNLRKRTLRDIENAHKFALERFINELLPVMDSLELGIKASESVMDTDTLKEGMNLTLKKFMDTLEKFGVTVVDPQGQKFNPEMHDAVSIADTDEYDSGIVMAVLQKGYELNGRLVRPAMVVVAK